MFRHVDAQEKILTEITVCSSVSRIPEVFSPAENVFGDCFGVPRHVDAKQAISS